MPAAPPLQPWAGLDANLLSSVVDRCTDKDYAACRAVCGAWHSALPPPLSQPLAVLPADATAGHPVSLAACLLHTRRWLRLPGLHQPTRLRPDDCRCVGARDGWFALVSGDAATGGAAILFDPRTGEEIALDAASLYEPRHDPAPKIAFSRDPKPHDFAAVSLCRPKRVAVQVRANHGGGGGSFRAVHDTDMFMDGAVLVDVAYGDDGRVYCLASGGQVYVIRFERRRRGSRSVPAVEVQPLLSGRLGPEAFPPPYDAISQLTDAKSLVLCDDGTLYQVWRRPTGSGPATVDAPPGPSQQRLVHVHEGDVFVLRYNPTSGWPRWILVADGKDLGGKAIFVGMNDAVVARGDGVSPNSVYYWDNAGVGDHSPVVYSLETGSSVRWPTATGGLSSPVWYFMPEDSQNRRAEAPDMESTIAHGEATRPEYDYEDDPPDILLYHRFCSKKNRTYGSSSYLDLHDDVSKI